MANDRTGFLYLGTSPDTDREHYSIAMPYPTVGRAVFETSRMVDSARNANGALVGRQVGRSVAKQNMVWDKIDCGKWWEFNKWIEANHFTFYCHYFDFNLGYWRTNLFYVGDIKCTPGPVSTETGMPMYLSSASVNVIDCGV